MEGVPGEKEISDADEEKEEAPSSSVKSWSQKDERPYDNTGTGRKNVPWGQKIQLSFSKSTAARS